MPKRDEFSPAVKATLAKRVNYHCSNCGAPTVGPHSDPDKAISVGQAAHITAAGRGGPRFDENLTPKQRSAAKNGIWCCNNCARLIDSDYTRFTPDELQQRKRDAEASASAGIKARPSPKFTAEADLTASIGAATRTIQEHYHVGNPGQVLQANIKPLASHLLSELREPRRTVVVAPYSAPETLLRQDHILASVSASRIRARKGLSFPPVSIEDGEGRLAHGLVWKAMQIDREFVVGFDASFAVRDRTVEDRVAEGRSRKIGDVGIFTTMELAIGAILFARNLDRELGKHPRWWMRVDLLGVSGRNLIYDPPVLDRTGSPWLGRPMTATADQVVIEANFPADQTDTDIASFGNEIADAIGYWFKAEGPVKALQVGKLIMKAIAG